MLFVEKAVLFVPYLYLPFCCWMLESCQVVVPGVRGSLPTRSNKWNKIQYQYGIQYILQFAICHPCWAKSVISGTLYKDGIQHGVPQY